jgi:serine/threonine protein kinase
MTEIIKRLGPKTNVVRRDKNVYVHTTFEANQDVLIKKAKKLCEMKINHPNIIAPFNTIDHENGSVTLETEFADAGPLHIYIPFFPLNTRIAVAKSVLRQVAEGLYHMHAIYDMEHKNLNPKKIFVRRDGCIKIGPFDAIDENTPAEELFDSVYCAPEYRMSLDPEESYEKRLEMGEKGDIWALGVLIIAIVSGNLLISRDRDFFDNIVFRSTDLDWKNFIPDSALRYITKRCFNKTPKERPSIMRILSLIYIFGNCELDAYPDAIEDDIETVVAVVYSPIGENPFTTRSQGLNSLPAGKEIMKLIFFNKETL